MYKLLEYRTDNCLQIPICSKSSTQSIAIAQIFPPTGVDPFALIKSCEGAKRKSEFFFDCDNFI